MKKYSFPLIKTLIFIAALLTSGTVQAQMKSDFDFPGHIDNATNSDTCLVCHYIKPNGFGLEPIARGSEQETFCKTCHNPTGLAPRMTNVSNHVSINGLDNGTVDCTTCHDPHAYHTTINTHDNNTKADNLHLIRDVIDTARVPGAISPIVFQDNQTAFTSAPFNGVCQACHTKTSHYKNNGTGQDHNPDSNCISCHTHKGGFADGSTNGGNGGNYFTSGHADQSSIVFHDWDDSADKKVPSACSQCHSTSGYRDYIGADGTAKGINNTGIPIGEVITCAACHNATTDAYAPNNLTVQFPPFVISTSDPVLGKTVSGIGRDGICIQCHSGRSSGTTINNMIVIANTAATGYTPPSDNDTVSSKLSFKNVHYLGAAVAQYGKLAGGGYQYAGKNYDGKFSHAPGVTECFSCHDAHSLDIKINVCQSCHDVSTLTDIRNMRMNNTDYDGDGDVEEGFEEEVAGVKAKLLIAIQQYASEVSGQGIEYDGNTNPYWFKAGIAHTSANSFKSYTIRLSKAVYNYQVATKDPGAFAHGGKYIIELLYDSIQDLNAGLVAKLKTPTVDLTLLKRNGLGHFDGMSEAFRHWDATGLTGTNTACAKCHAGTGIQAWLDANNGDGTTTANTSSSWASTLGTPAQIFPTAPVAGTDGFACLNCHSNTNDYTVRNVMTQAKNAAIGTMALAFPSGITVTKLGSEGVCIACHSGRESTVSIDSYIGTQSSAPDTVMTTNNKFYNSHYLAAAAAQYGAQAKGYYEYAGNAYVQKFEHVTGYDTCIGCHDPHNLEVKIDECKLCHTNISTSEDFKNIRMNGSLVDFDGDGNTAEGIYAEVEGVKAKLWAAIQAYASAKGLTVTYTPAAYPYFASVSTLSSTTSWTPRLLKAAYNLNMLTKEPGAYAHNAKYIIQVLYDGIVDLNAGITALGGTTVDITGLNRVAEGHFDGTGMPWRDWDKKNTLTVGANSYTYRDPERSMVSNTCTKCHAPDGLNWFYSTKNPDGTAKLAETTPTQSVAAVKAGSGMACINCHTSLSTFAVRDITDVPFPYQATGAAAVPVSRYDFGDASNICASCHQGRAATSTVNNTLLTSTNWTVPSVHYLPAAGVLLGSNVHVAYEFSGKTYVGRNDFGGASGHNGSFDNCIKCHMGKGGPTANMSHRVSTPAKENCVTCHGTPAEKADPELFEFAEIRGGSTPDYDGDGNTAESVEAEIEGLRDALIAALQAYANTTTRTGTGSTAYNGKVVFNLANGSAYWDANGNGVYDSTETTGYRSTNKEFIKAAYNLKVVCCDPGSFVHNAKYIAQLLIDSIEAVGGSITGYVRP